MSGRLDVMTDGPAIREPTVTLDSWLAVFIRLLDVPAGDRDAIRRELEAHLGERVRDLIIDGCSEERAVAQAIEELGETAELARSFRSANRYPRRRLAMNLAMSAVGAGIVGLGVVAFRPDPGTVASVPAVWYAQESKEASAAGLDTRVEAAFEDASLEEVVEYLSATMGRTILVHWSALAEHEVFPEETRVNLTARALPARRLMDLLLESIEDPWGETTWLLDDELIELGPQDLFDRRDISLASYDVSSIIWRMGRQYSIVSDDAAEQIVSLMHDLVAPEKWMANGGELAQVRVVGGKMFVQAPRRMHHEVAWILEQLSDGAAGQGGDARGESGAGVYGGGGAGRARSGGGLGGRAADPLGMGGRAGGGMGRPGGGGRDAAPSGGRGSGGSMGGSAGGGGLRAPGG